MIPAVAETKAVDVEEVRVATFAIPTPTPESDGTYEWHQTTMVVVELTAAGETGLGYTYADHATARVVADHLAPVVRGHDVFATEARWEAMWAQLRNVGVEGIAAMAVSAVDTALWDLKARLLGAPLVDVLGAARPALPLYGSGGFCSYTERQLRQEFERWRALGLTRFKMKVAREPGRDPARLRWARTAIGDDAELFVDANSGYRVQEAAAWAHRYVNEWGVTWFEEPVPPSDLEGLREIRRQAPPPLELADGEYGYGLAYFRRLLEADAVDVVQADLTRCGGVTGFMKVAALCQAWRRPLSSHCAPALHLHPGCAAAPLRHAEFFADHERIEAELLDGVPSPRGGVLTPDRTRPGHGLRFRWAEAERYAE